MAKKIAIIGAGIAGLSAGIYARKCGFESEIYEMHTLPGGFCTAWKRQGFTFDGCIHWLTGSGKRDSFYPLWQELGAIQDKSFHDPEVFQSYESEDGRVFKLFVNPDQLEEHLISLSKKDERISRQFCGWIRSMTRFDMPMDYAFELMGPWHMVGMLARMVPIMKPYQVISKVTIKDLADRFKDPLIQEGLLQSLGTPAYPAANLIITLALLNKKAGGFPLGGSFEFAKGIEKTYIGLGGKVEYGKKVKRIIVKDESAAGLKDPASMASGIELEDGRVIHADYVISSVDLRTTIHNLLGDRFSDPQHEELIRDVPVAPSSVNVYFGLNKKFTPGYESSNYRFYSDLPVKVGNTEHRWISEKNYNFDPSMAPPGGSVICVMFPDYDYDYWSALRENRQEYNSVKKELVQTLIGIFEKRYPGFADSVVATDAATPATFSRYTGSWHGTYMTWIIPPKKTAAFRLIRKTLPGLDRFYMVGQWVMPPGGLPTGVKTGRDVIQIICKKESRKFTP